MQQLSALSVAGVMAAGYALAGQTEENRQQAWACYEAKDWACAFDAMIDNVMADGEKACASDPRHACDFEMMALYEVAFAYAESQTPHVRISIADRSLLALSRLTDAKNGAQDDFLMNGMKYSACRTLKNTGCEAAAKASLHRAMRGLEADDVLGYALQFDPLMKIGLAEAFKEVSAKEMKQ